MADIVSLKEYKQKKEDKKKAALIQSDDQEYLIFINLLRYFMELSRGYTSTVEAVDVYKDDKMEFRILNHSNSEDITINSVCCSNEIDEIDDFIISNLIAVAPCKIHVHSHENYSDYLLETLESVFNPENIIYEEDEDEN